jgi:16S rRNA (cytosine967-C5)-methyltransferase
VNAREIAFDLLVHWQRSHSLADDLLDEQLGGTRLSAADRALVTELFYGCLRNRLALEYLFSQVAAKKPRPAVAAILSLGLYQIFFLERIPAHAAVHETVELAKSRHGGASVAEAGFVNAVLRRALNERETLAAKLRATRDSEPWVYYSHPRWLFERWRSRWGNKGTLALCEWNNAPPVLYVRMNTLKRLEGAAPAALQPGEAQVDASTNSAQALRPPSDVGAEPSVSHPLCWRVTEPDHLFRTKSWANGEFYVQDPSTLLAVDVLDPQPGESILDMCAAPGGKTTYIAQKMQNRGRIIAADSSNARLGLVAENCKRLGVAIAATLPCEGTRLDRCLRGEQFDRVLVDAPCSNTGVLRRRVDLRWRIEEKEINRLAALQQNLLAMGALLTRRDGVLVYSTCSLEPEENERVVERFCEIHPQFTLETTRSTFPPRDRVDGAFVARFRSS